MYLLPYIPYDIRNSSFIKTKNVRFHTETVIPPHLDLHTALFSDINFNLQKLLVAKLKFWQHDGRKSYIDLHNIVANTNEF